MIVLLTFTPLFCPNCGSHADVYGHRLEEFEAYKVVFCINCGQKWQKVSEEVAKKAATETGGDLTAWLKE